MPSRHAVDAARSVRVRGAPRPQGAHALCRGRAAGAALGRQERRQFRVEERRRAGRRALCSGAEPPGRQDGRDRHVRGRQARHPALQRPASADQGHGPRRRRRRGHLRHSGRRLAPQRPRGLERDAAHLQRFPQGFLPPLSGPRDRPRLSSVWRHRRRGEGDPSGRQDGHQGPRTVLLLGHGPDVASGLGAAVERGRRGAVAVALPHLPDDLAAGPRGGFRRRSAARRCSPASRPSRWGSSTSSPR